MIKLVMLIHFDQQKAAWFESDFCVSSATLMIIDNGPPKLNFLAETQIKWTDFVFTRAVIFSTFSLAWIIHSNDIIAIKTLLSVYLFYFI